MAPRSASISLEDFGDAVWRAHEWGCAAGDTLATGHAALDAQLPGGGWPVGAISEILQAPGGQHEWRLLLPALTRATAGPVVVLVGAPHVPFGPGLIAQGLDSGRLLWVSANAPADRLWATEQALRCAALRCAEVAAVLTWLPQVRAEPLRRLQIAAHTHSKLLFVMRPACAQRESSPAILRLLVAHPPPGTAAPPDAVQLKILKRRGPPLAQTLLLPARSASLGVLLALSGSVYSGGGSGQGEEGGDALDCLAAAA